MNVSLTPELERLVNEKVESGLHQTASEIVREALRLLRVPDQAPEQLRADVQAGFDQLARMRIEPTTRPQAGNSPSGSNRAVVRRDGAVRQVASMLFRQNSMLISRTGSNPSCFSA